MVYTIKKCKKCGKRTKKLYYHANRKDNKKWIPILHYCFHCNIFNGSAKGKGELKIQLNKISKDYRYTGEIHQIRGKSKLIDKIDKEILKKIPDFEIKKLEKTETNDYCYGKMIKLYGLFREKNKQTWKPVFWYCINCRQVISKI